MAETAFETELIESRAKAWQERDGWRERAEIAEAALAEVEAQLKPPCVNCGRTEPCELDKAETSGDPDNWPGSPCTFDPTPQQLYERLKRVEAQRDAARALLVRALQEHDVMTEEVGESSWCPDEVWCVPARALLSEQPDK